MVSLFAFVIGELLTPTIRRFFWHSVKRFPAAFAGLAFVGQGLGVWLIDQFVPAGDWAMAGLGVLCLTFYTGLLGLLAVKWWAGTWGIFCDYSESLFE